MRTRKEIEELAYMGREYRFSTNKYILEVMLDIRDLLTKEIN